MLIKDMVKTGVQAAEMVGKNADTAAKQTPPASMKIQDMSANRPPASVVPNPKVKKATVSDIVHESMISGMLSGPQTHIFNMADTSIKALTAPLETATRALVSVGRKAEDKTYLRESAYEAYGLMHGFGKALAYSGARLKSKIPGMPSETTAQTLRRFGLPEDLSRANKLGITERNITGEKILGTGEGLLAKSVDAIGAIVNAPGTMMNSADMLGKIGHYQRIHFGRAGSLQAQGRAQNFRDAWSVVENDPDMAKKAVNTAEEWTYTGAPDSYIKFILSPKMDGIPMMRWAVPFRRAIANLYEHTLERSPLIATSPTLTKKLFSKDPAVADAARSKFMFGTTALTFTGMLFYDNEPGSSFRLNGEAPMTGEEQDAWLRHYGNPDTLYIGDEGYDLRNLGVYGNFLKLIARYNQFNANVKPPEGFTGGGPNAEQDKYLANIGQFVAPIFDVMYDNHWGQNLVEFMNVLHKTANDVQDGKPPTRFTNWYERMMTNAVPVVGSKPMGEIAKTGQFMGVQLTDEYDPSSKRLRQIGDAFFQNIPGLRQVVPTNYTWDGHPRILGSLHKSVAGRNIVQDTYGPKDKLDALLAELQVDFSESPDTMSWEPVKPGYPPTVKRLTEAERKEFNTLRLTGFAGLPPVRQFLKDAMVNTKYFKGLQPWEQQIELENTYSLYMNKAVEFYKHKDITVGADIPVAEQSVGTRLVNQYIKQAKYLQQGAN